MWKPCWVMLLRRERNWAGRMGFRSRNWSRKWWKRTWLASKAALTPDARANSRPDSGHQAAVRWGRAPGDAGLEPAAGRLSQSAPGHAGESWDGRRRAGPSGARRDAGPGAGRPRPAVALGAGPSAAAV